MKPQLSVEVFDEYLKVTLSGEGNPFAHVADINNTIMTVKKLSEENKRTRVLVDAFNVPNVRDMQKFYIGALDATIFGNKLKISVASHEESSIIKENYNSIFARLPRSRLRGMRSLLNSSW